MDPFSLALGVAGLGISLFGASQQSSGIDQKQAGQAAAYKAQQQQVQYELQGERVKQNYMEMDTRRKSLQIMREQQRANALAVNNASSQGGMFGSGLQGGLAQVAGNANTNQVGITNSLMFGRQMFDVNANISNSKMDQLQGQMQSSQGEAQMAHGAGLMSLGSSVMGAMGPMKQLAGGGGSIIPPFFSKGFGLS